ncbi:LacI family DNA-binding transcriptional regulator [Acrocarpospora catenulata]|uniref:LacI family DNA-binding transcriptional regulator n=1 Tax=Acrocarpospora catenulata TaxID=2836182 RepID=UPI001BDA1C4B|nr:LacI family DNA-binding transcriptional regulator [Acrocarpospora catenulata]
MAEPKPPAAKRPTMKQVAARAGVDVSLVSRLLNDDPRLSIAPDTRRRVMDAVRELGYRRNLTARSLRTSRGLMVAFLLPEFTNPVYSRIVAGAHRRAASLGYAVMLSELDDTDAEDMRGHQARGVDGVLLAAGNLEDARIAELCGGDLPVIAVNRQIPGSRRWAVVDYGLGGRLAAEHLRELGHRRVGVLTGPGRFDSDGSRVRGFADALGDAVGGEDPPVVVADGLTPDDGLRAGAELLARHPEVTAVFATTLMLGVGLLRAASEAGIAVPGELSIVSLHDVDLARFMSPPLTTVAMPMVELGAAAFDQLLAVIDGQDPEPTVMTQPPVLVRRASTAPPRKERR